MKYRGINTTQTQKLKEFEKGNAHLKQLVADLSVEIAILKEVLSKSKPGQTSSGGSVSADMPLLFAPLFMSVHLTL